MFMPLVPITAEMRESALSTTNKLMAQFESIRKERGMAPEQLGLVVETYTMVLHAVAMEVERDQHKARRKRAKARAALDAKDAMAGVAVAGIYPPVRHIGGMHTQPVGPGILGLDWDLYDDLDDDE